MTSEDSNKNSRNIHLIKIDVNYITVSLYLSDDTAAGSSAFCSGARRFDGIPKRSVKRTPIEAWRAALIEKGWGP
jgi:hypothetical protein